MPAVMVQHWYITRNCHCGAMWCWCIWKIMPFIYGIPIFTGIFISLKELKTYHIKGNEKLKGPVLQVSDSARTIYRIIRILSTSMIIIVIWYAPYLKTLQIEYFAYIIIANAFDALSLAIYGLVLMVNKLLKRCFSVRYREEVYHSHKLSVFHPEHIHDCSYKTEKIIGEPEIYLYI